MSEPAENKPPYVLDEQVGYLLRLATQRHTALFQSLIPDGITPTQFSAMIRLSQEGACSQNHLGRLAGMDVATIKGVIDRLTQKGLTRVEADPNDRRRSAISLTDDGAAMIERLTQAGHQVTDATLAPLTKVEQRNLLKILAKMT